MNSHIKRKDLIDFLFGTGRDILNREIERHLSECNQCKREFELLKKIFRSSNNTNLEPSENLHKRILSSCNNLRAKGNKGNPVKKYVKKKFKPALVSAFSFLFIAILVFALNNRKTNRDISQLSMVINNIVGDVSVNNKVKDIKKYKLGESSVIKTGDNSSVEIMFNDNVLIKVTCNTVLEIEKAFYNKDENKYNFSFNVKRGVIFSHFQDDNRKYLYRLKTPNSNIYSSGTKFLLSASDMKTVLLVTDGTMLIQSEDRDEVAAFRNQKYIVTDTISLKEVTKKDKNLIAWIKDKKVITDRKTVAKNKPEQPDMEVALGDKCGKLKSILEKGNPKQ